VPHEPLTLFRVLHRNPELASRMFALGAGLLGHGLLPAVDREIVIARVAARTGCACEWGAHAATLAQQAGLGPEQLRATTDIDTAANAVWLPRHAALLDAVDELHATAHLSQPAWDALRAHYDDAQLLGSSCRPAGIEPSAIWPTGSFWRRRPGAFRSRLGDHHRLLCPTSRDSH